MSKYICNVCGSEDIEVKAWVKANTDEVVEWCDDESPECWCNDCGEMTTFARVGDIE